MELRPWETMTPALWGPGFLLEEAAWEGNLLANDAEWLADSRVLVRRSSLREDHGLDRRDRYGRGPTPHEKVEEMLGRRFRR